MTFNELLALVSSTHLGRAPGIRVDSRSVKEGDIFVAVKGTVYDGHDFIDQALAKGAKYIVAQNPEPSIEHRASSIEVMIVDDSSEAAALLAQASRGNPASQLTNLAVTGTNGKTTVAYLVRSVVQEAGEKCGLIGTIIYDTGSASSQAVLTTPGCLAIAETQEQMVKAGSKYMVIEASSHALSQNRLAGINFKAAAFTNLAGDHLDYHRKKEDYLAAKTKLFSALSPGATAVLNRQSAEAHHIAGQIRRRRTAVLWYAIDESADITAHIESMDINGTVFTLECAGQSSLVHHGTSIVKTPLLGRYNVSNHLAAAGLCLAAGFHLETIAVGLSALRAIPGRLERLTWAGLTAENTEERPHVERGAKYLAPPLRQGIAVNSASSAVKEGDFSVIIDYAHTDDALKNVLATLKPLCKGRLTVVFGCGGDRDRTKRPRMARVAEQFADFVIVTSDNPRTEQPEAIIDDIITGFEKGRPMRSSEIRNTQSCPERSRRDEIRNTRIIEPDRRKAIELAVKTAGKDDIVVIAGKGHETYQIIGSQKFDFSDKEVAEEYVKKGVGNSK